MIPFPSIILSATDGSQYAALAAQATAELSQKTGAELHLVHVGPHLPMPLIAADEKWVRRRWREARKKLDREVECVRAAGRKVKDAHLRFADEDQQIIALAREVGAGLLVIGTRGLDGIQGALTGKVTMSVVRQAHCAVLVVRSKDEVA
jgi:nucleotide-binding universal stress UspA family protein